MIALATALWLGAPALAQEDGGDDDRATQEGLFKTPEPKLAEKPWQVEWYGEPISRIELYHCTVCWSPWGLNVVTGLEGGVKYRQRAEPNLYGFSRAALQIDAGLLDQAIGVDLRIGSFFGQDHRFYRVYTGVDFFGNNYPFAGNGFSLGSGNFTLKWSEGVAWVNQGWVKLTRDFWLGFNVAPAFAFREDRQGAEIDGPFHEIAWQAEAAYLGNPRITVGFRWEKNAAGVFQSILIAAQL